MGDRVHVARPANRCGCDESNQLHRTLELKLEELEGQKLIALQHIAARDRVLNDLVDCERRLAKMTEERNELQARLEERPV